MPIELTKAIDELLKVSSGRPLKVPKIFPPADVEAPERGYPTNLVVALTRTHRRYLTTQCDELTIPELTECMTILENLLLLGTMDVYLFEEAGQDEMDESLCSGFADIFRSLAERLTSARYAGPANYQQMSYFSQCFGEWQQAGSHFDTDTLFTALAWINNELGLLLNEVRDKKRDVKTTKLSDLLCRPRPGRLQWLARAMVLVNKNPEYKDSRIAKMAGIDKSQLSRDPAYQMAARIARQGTPPPFGTKDGKTGGVEIDPEGNRGRRRGRTKAYDDPED